MHARGWILQCIIRLCNFHHVYGIFEDDAEASYFEWRLDIFIYVDVYLTGDYCLGFI